MTNSAKDTFSDNKSSSMNSNSVNNNSPVDIVVLTEDKYAPADKQLPELDWYTLQVLLEDELVIDALKQKKLNVIKKSWSDPDYDWSLCRAVLFRTTWDYFDRFGEFSHWLKTIESKVVCINDLSTILWNMDKRYLIEMAQKGIRSVDTYILPKGKVVNLKRTLEDHGLSEAILKPVVSGAARHTYRITKENIDDMEQKLSDLIKQEDFMLQPFQKNIMSDGELSLMVIDGKVTHAVRKIAAEGDFRVQDDHGGTVVSHQPDEDEIQFAEQAILACDPKPIYARVDIIRDNDDKLSLMELELIEPELFFRFHRPAAFALAEAIYQRLDS